MFFEQEYIVFEILDVLYLEQSKIKAFNSNRNFDALSFRYDADAIISTGKEEIELTDNSICYVPSNVNYTLDARKGKLIVIHFKSFNYHSDTIEHFLPENADKYRCLFEEILNCWNNREVSHKNEASSIFYKILSELYRDNQSVYKNTKIRNSLLYMEQNYLHSDFSISDAAAQSFISETYFRKLFKQEFGISPKQYIINRRVEYAKALIITGYFSIEKVSELCGYNDDKHFSTEFKKITGVSPSKYGYNYTEKQV